MMSVFPPAPSPLKRPLPPSMSALIDPAAFAAAAESGRFRTPAVMTYDWLDDSSVARTACEHPSDVRSVPSCAVTALPQVVSAWDFTTRYEPPPDAGIGAPNASAAVIAVGSTVRLAIA